MIKSGEKLFGISVSFEFSTRKIFLYVILFMCDLKMRSSFAQVETCRRLCQAEKEKLRTKASGRPRSSLGCSFMQRPQRVGGLSPTLPQVMGAGQSL